MNTLYERFVSTIENRVSPLAGRIGQQKYVQAIRDGFIAALPFMIVGSFMLVFIFPLLTPDPVGLRPRLARLLVDLPAAAVAAVPAEHGADDSVHLGGNRRQPGPPERAGSGHHGSALPDVLHAGGRAGQGWRHLHAVLLRPGIFTALITAIYAAEVYAFLKRNNITIKLPPQVPTGVARSFEVLIPVLVIILTLHPLNLLLENSTGMILPEAIMSLVKPLVAASDSLPAMLLAVLVCQILWFAGIHGALIVTGIMNPFWMANLASNQAAMAAGERCPTSSCRASGITIC